MGDGKARREAQPEAGAVTRGWPQHCGLCDKMMESLDDRTMWHGLGNCIDICSHCDGTGAERASVAPSVEELEQAAQRVVKAVDRMAKSNDTYNPFNQDFVRPWTELYAAGEALRAALERKQSQ